MNELEMPLTRVTWTMLVPAAYAQAYPVWPWLVAALLVCVVRPEMPRSAETVDDCGQPAAVPPPDDPEPELAEPDALATEVLPPAAVVDEDEDSGPHPASRPTTAIPIRADVVIRMFSEGRAAIQQIVRIWQFIYIMFGNIPAC
jgi:hypothetical protein